MALKIKDKELKAILKEVEDEVAGLLKAETDRLAKAADEDGGSEPDGDEGGGSAGPVGGEPSAPPAEGSASADPAEASASAPGPAEGSAPTDPAAPGADPAADAGPIDPESLKAEYSALAPEELKVHYLACKAALAEAMGGMDPDAGGSAGGPPGAPAPGPEASASAPPMGPPGGAPPMAPPPGPEASASAPAQPLPPPAMKAEVPANVKNNPANGGTERAAVPDSVKSGKLGKSEVEISDLNKAETQIKELEQQVEGLAKAVELLVAPQRKAVTSVAFLSKGEAAATEKREPTKAEIKTKLSEVAKLPSLKKSDRERIISYEYGNIGYEQIKDLLEKK